MFNNYSENKILKYDSNKISFKDFEKLYINDKNRILNNGKIVHLVIGIMDKENNFIDSNMFISV